MAEMTLQEAIDHAREVANGLHPNIDGCSECAKQHGQLADWLEELQEFKRVGATPADVRPVIRGRWINEERVGFGSVEAECSNCGRRMIYNPAWRCCPWCMADMRGGDAE